VLLVLAVLLLLAGAAALWLGLHVSALDKARRAIARGDFARARLWAEEAARGAGDDLTLAQALDELGAVHRFEGANRQAEDCYRRALHLRQQHLPPDHHDIAVGLGNLALSLVASGRATEAEPLYRRAVTILRQAGGDQHADVALCLGELGQACLYTGKFDESAELLDQSLQLTERIFGRNHARTAQALLLQAGGAAIRGEARLADRVYRACRLVSARVHGPNHPATLIAVQQHANLLIGWARLTGDAAALTEAEELAQQFVERARANLGLEHQMTASGLGSLARVRTLQHRPAEAVRLARDALRILEAALGPSAARTGYKRLILSRALDEADELAEAEEHATRARAVYEQVFGLEHFEMGHVYEQLGRLAARQRRFAEAEEHLRRSLSLRQPLGPTHPLRALTLRELLPVLQQTGRSSEADAVADEVATLIAEARQAS
jgi:tetratricopeptide (TPR) repeat protein